MKLVVAFRSLTIAPLKKNRFILNFKFIYLFLLILVSINDFVFCFRHGLLTV